MGGWRGLFLTAAALAAVAAGAPVVARAETGPSGSDGVAQAPVWIAPSEKPGAGAPAAEARAGCGDLVAWAEGPAGSGTWAARPTGGPGSTTGSPVVIGTWHRAAGGMSPLASLGQLAPGRYQLTFEGDLMAARALTVDCPAAAAPAVLPASSLAAPQALPYAPRPTDAEGSTIPPIGEETVAAASWAPAVPRSPVTGLLAVGLLAAIGLVAGTRRTG